MAKAAAEAFGGRPKVTRFRDDAGSSSVDLLECADRPTPGVTSCSTLGLSDHPLVQDGAEYPARLEIVGASATDNELFGNVITSAAFAIINDQLFCCPGAVFPGLVEHYYPDLTTKHLFFVPPFLWQDELPTMRLATKTVAWLLAVPITDAEAAYAGQHGAEALEDLFERAQIDLFDLDRDSAA